MCGRGEADEEECARMDEISQRPPTHFSWATASAFIGLTLLVVSALLFSQVHKDAREWCHANKKTFNCLELPENLMAELVTSELAMIASSIQLLYCFVVFLRRKSFDPIAWIFFHIILFLLCISSFIVSIYFLLGAMDSFNVVAERTELGFKAPPFRLTLLSLFTCVDWMFCLIAPFSIYHVVGLKRHYK